MDTIKEYWHGYLWRDAVRKLITINTIVWVVISIAQLTMGAAAEDWIKAIFALPGDLDMFLRHPWTVVTSMFAQVTFLHLLVNMMWLLLFGEMMMHVLGSKRLTAIYLMGGLCGCLGFILVNLLMPGMHIVMMGASCAVLAIAGAAATLMPNWRVNLLIFGQVRLLWITVTAIVLFVVLTPSIDVSVAHGAGLLYGLAYGFAKKRGTDITDHLVHGWEALAERLPRRVPRARVNKNAAHSYGPATANEHAELDELLDKVSRSGYASLSASERQRLFQLSQKIKH